MGTRQKMITKAKRFYHNECKENPSKFFGVLYAHNLIDEFNQVWSAKFDNGKFVAIKLVAKEAI